MLVLLLICVIFDQFLVVFVAPNGNAKGSFLLFFIVNESYEYYKAQSAISLFKLNNVFTTFLRFQT